ncbi:MAG: (d)CMP kinase [Planctomycetota bacterium]|nr:(d)CMP kinase [Planctomycetota bacterium]
MAELVITIDGPAASGKSTVARLVAQKLGASFLDTGAMYRAVTLAAIKAGVNMSDEKKLLGIMRVSKFQFSVKDGLTTVSIDGVNVTEQIRSPEVTAKARYIASAAKIREKLVQMQRRFAAGEKKLVTEGRDQGTVAFDDADIKFYLTADAGERARRRQEELVAKGDSKSLEEIQKAIEERDKSDQTRTVGPLKPAEDAIIIDTTDLDIEEVVEKVLGFVKEKCLKKS